MKEVLQDDKQLVLDLVKQWFVENDAALVATEDTIVFWGNPTGEAAAEDWEQIDVPKAVRFIKATHLPFHLMYLISSDLVRAAAQELERVYLRLAKIKGLAAPGCFNLNQKVAVSAEDRITTELLRWIQKSKQNMVITDFDAILRECFKQIGSNLGSKHRRNRLIRRFIGLTNLILTPNNNRVRVDGKHATAIRHEKVLGAMEIEDISPIVYQILVNAKALAI